MLFETVGIVFVSILEMLLLSAIFYYLLKYEKVNKYVLCVAGSASLAFLIENSLLEFIEYRRAGNYILMTAFCIVCTVISAPVHHRSTLIIVTSLIGAFCFMRGFTIFVSKFTVRELLQDYHPQFKETLEFNNNISWFLMCYIIMFFLSVIW
jgi:hypothetical protein